MRSAVYNRFWHSQGGGERHAGMVAQVLSLAPGAGQVDLVGHTPVDLAELGSHLGLDLARCTYRQIPDRGDAALAAFSSDYDFWLTASYMSRLAPESARSAYLCWFPTPFDHDLAPWRKKLAQVVGPHLRGPSLLTYGAGWYPPEGGRRRRWVWSSGDGVLSVPPGRRRRLRMAVGRPGAPTPTRLSIQTSDGREVASADAGSQFRRLTVELPPSERGDELRFISDVFAPGGPDVRELGVAISRAWLQSDGPGIRAYTSARLPWLARDPNDLQFLEGYDAVLANSAYTREWIGRLWHRDAAVLHPPIETGRFIPATDREPVIACVGAVLLTRARARETSTRDRPVVRTAASIRAARRVAAGGRRWLRAEPGALPGAGEGCGDRAAGGDPPERPPAPGGAPAVDRVHLLVGDRLR